MFSSSAIIFRHLRGRPIFLMAPPLPPYAAAWNTSCAAAAADQPNDRPDVGSEAIRTIGGGSVYHAYSVLTPSGMLAASGHGKGLDDGSGALPSHAIGLQGCTKIFENIALQDPGGARRMN